MSLGSGWRDDDDAHGKGVWAGWLMERLDIVMKRGRSGCTAHGQQQSLAKTGGEERSQSGGKNSS